VVGSAYFKTLLPGTQSKFAEGKADPLQSDLSQQAAILERAIGLAKDLGTDKVRIFFLVSAAGSASRTDFSSMALGCTSYLSPRISSARLRDCDSDARTTFTGPPLELQELRASPPGMLSR
jgi:hypothetical protein